MNWPEVLRRFRHGERPSIETMRAFVHAVADGSIPDYQISAFLMASAIQGLSSELVSTMTESMVTTGRTSDLSSIDGLKVDKHSTGGVGDKVSICLAPIVAACGVKVPMICGRALGQTGGTLDKLDAIPGFETRVDEGRFQSFCREAGLAFGGQSDALAPVDRTLYALRDVTGTVESIDLITSSILCKKIAAGAEALVLDVKVGRGAFCRERKDAQRLAESLLRVGQGCGLKVRALITDMNQPLGRAVGNGIEVAEAIQVLEGDGPEDLVEVTEAIAVEMIRMADGSLDVADAQARVREVIASGAALEKFRKCVEVQGGDPRVVGDTSLLPKSSQHVEILADASGFVQSIDAFTVGFLGIDLGIGRTEVTDPVDTGAGIYFHRTAGDEVAKGDLLATVYCAPNRSVDSARLLGAFSVADEPPPPRGSLIHSRM